MVPLVVFCGVGAPHVSLELIVRVQLESQRSFELTELAY